MGRNGKRAFWLSALLLGGGLAPRQTVAVADELQADELQADWSQIRQSVHPWERYVRGFRREHHFALTGGTGSSQWRIDHFGNIERQAYRASLTYGKFQYSFHLPLWEHWGYYLGSSAGYSIPIAWQEKEFRSGAAIHLPGFLIGFTWNFSPAWRLMSGIDNYLVRYEGLSDLTADPHKRLSATMLALLDGELIVDYFYDLHWAIRLESHWRQILYQGPRAAGGRVEGADFTVSEHAFGLGMVYHFL